MVNDSPTGPFQLQTFEIIQPLHLLEVVMVRRKKLLGRSQHSLILALDASMHVNKGQDTIPSTCC